MSHGVEFDTVVRHDVGALCMPLYITRALCMLCYIFEALWCRGGLVGVLVNFFHCNYDKSLVGILVG